MEEVRSEAHGKWISRKRARNEELDFGGIIRLFIRHKFLLLVLSLSAFGTALLSHVLIPSYRVNASLVVYNSDTNPLQAVSVRIGGGLGLGAFGEKSVPEKYFQQLSAFEFYLSLSRFLKDSSEFKSMRTQFFVHKKFLTQLIDKLRGTKTITDQELSDKRLAVILQDWLSFNRRGNNTIDVSLTAPDAELALVLVNMVAEFAADYLTKNELIELNEAERYVHIQLEQSEKSTKEIEAEIVEFKRTNNIFSMDASNRDIATRAFEMRREIEETTTQMSQNQKLIDTHSKELKKIPFSGLASRGFTTGVRPKFGLSRRIDELNRENQYLDVRRSTLQKIYDDLMKTQDPSQEQHVFELRKKMEVQYGLYQEIKKQLFQIEMQKIIAKNKVRTFEKAQDFEIHRSINLRKKIGLALLLAILIGGFSAYVWEILFPTVKGRQDIDDLNLIFLGSIPDLDKQPRKVRQLHLPRTKASTPTLCRFDIDSTVSMSFKYIRARIQHIRESQTTPLQVITVLSANHCEGKSFISGNLAACIAFMRKNTLLIDCDLRKTTTSELFKTAHLSGLGEVLKGTKTFDELVKPNVLPKLDLLPGGTFSHDITELIASNKFLELINDLRKRYEYIILDTPPLATVPDSALVAKRSDMLVMVATVNSTTLESIERASDLVWDFGGKNVYAVLNKVEGLQDYVYIVPQSARDESTIDTNIDNVRKIKKI